MVIDEKFKYNLNYILELTKKTNNFEFNWDLNLIQKLALEVGAPTYKKTPIFKKKIRSKKNDNNLSSSDWEYIRNFKSTPVKQKEGIEIIFGKIKSEMFKITDKTYNSQKEKIIDILNEVEGSSLITDDNKDEIKNIIYNIASTNLFYSKIYAKIFKELNDIFSLIDNNFKDRIDKFFEKLKNIEIVFENNNYDKLCEVNKDNDIRVANVIFFVNLMNEELIDKDLIIDLIIKLQNYLVNLIRIENQNEKIEHISDILNEIIKNCYLRLSEHDKWNIIKENIIIIKDSNISDNCSLTNKTIFIHMDLYDIINN